MSRRAQAPVRHILPDPKFKSDMLAKFMNVVMESGKKSAAERIIYGAIDRITEKTGKQGGDALGVLSQALDNVKPVGRSEVASRRWRHVSGPRRSAGAAPQTLAMRWVIEAAARPLREVHGVPSRA
jgi:small subunit ribosomal protein S7